MHVLWQAVEPFENDSPPRHVILLTPVGRGAVATVLVEGPNAAEVVGRWFQAASGKLVNQTPLGRIAFGRWHSEEGLVEELVICRRSETQIEVHCHGGVAAAENILRSLAGAGLPTLDWQSWARQTEPDPIAAEARVALAAAQTERAALVLLDQYNGAPRTAIDCIAELCEHGSLAQAAAELNGLLRYESLGRHLAAPWRVVLAGAPNVGKSSLINALVGFERAIVFDEPGTTRDVLTAFTAFDGWPVALSDTAGLRPATDDIEAQGVAKAREQIAAADLVLFVFDATQAWSPADQELANSIPNALVILNKCDLLVGAACRPALDSASNLSLNTSAKTGVGIKDLMCAISQRLVPSVPAPGAAVPFTREQIDALRSALIHVEHADGPVAAAVLRALTK